MEIELDEDAEEGTVIVDNGSEIVDAGVPTQLEFLKEIMRTTRGEGGSEVSEAFEIASDSVQGESLEESAAKGVEDSAAVLTETAEAAGDTAEAYAAEEAATAAESTAEPEDTVSEAEEEVPQQVNFADVMADVMSGRAEESAGTAETAGQDEFSETAVDEAAALMADLMEEAKAAGVQTDKTEAAEITAEEVPKPAKSRKKKQAAE